MTDSEDPYYRLAPGLEVVPMAEDRLLLRSDSLAIRIDGEAAGVLSHRILPLLDGRRPFSEIAARLPDLSAELLRERLEALVGAQVLRRSDSAWDAGQSYLPASFLAMLDSLGVSARDATARLRVLHVTILGLEMHGAHLASLLAAHGVGRVLLVDPFPSGTVSPRPTPPIDDAFAGQSRQDIVQRQLAASCPAMQVQTAGPITLSRESVETVGRETNLLVGCFNRDFESAQHWINRASLELEKPAVYAQSSAHVALVGPFVLPGQTPCYMCYRMRGIACASDFQEAMAYEEFVNRRKIPPSNDRPAMPSLAPYIASILALEIIKRFVVGSPPSLAGRLLEFDALSLRTEMHPILRQPECPVCGAKKKRDRNRPTFRELTQPVTERGDILAAASVLVSPRTGVVRNCERFGKDNGEPLLPYVVRADVANHRFLEEDEHGSNLCSGKGMTLDAARRSALGEAVERYSSACHTPDEVEFATRSSLGDAALNPRRLALFFPDQYAGLPYAPYRDESVMGWISARSLATDALVSVPALAAFMNYQTRTEEEFIFPITSNGLATGPTLLEAVVAAATEVIERDAFLITWLNRLPVRCFRAETHPDSAMVDLCLAYRRRGVELRLYQLPTDMPCSVFAGIAIQITGDGPAAVVGLGADADPVHAARKALLEAAQVRPALRRRMRQPKSRQRLAELLEDSQRVETLDDHDLLYASRESLPNMAFLLDQESQDFAGQVGNDRTDPGESLARFVERLRATGSDLLYVNLTPPDMASLHLYTVRVILPGFQPIDFGWKERRLAGERLYSLPRTLGLRANTTTRGELHDAPHPLA